MALGSLSTMDWSSSLVRCGVCTDWFSGMGIKMKINGVRWFTAASGCVGVVQVEDEYDGIKYFIAPVGGKVEEFDTQYVADWGSTFPKSAGDKLFEVMW